MRILVALSLLTGCFSDPPPAGAGEDTSSTADPSTGTATTSATTSTSPATTGTSIESGTASDTGACEPQVITDVVVVPQTVNLFVVALPSVPPSTYEPIPPGLLDVLLGPDSEDLRIVFGSDGTGVPPVSAKHVCPGCGMPDLCSSTIDYTLMGEAFIEDLFTAAFIDAFGCVLHPEEEEPRARLLVVAALADEIVDGDLDTMGSVAAAGSDIDLICSGCSAEGPSAAEQLVASFGGLVYDLDDPQQFPDAMFRAAVAPPACLWPVSDEVEPPLTLADLELLIDPCGDPDTCPVAYEQVTGAGACDGMPVIPQFYVTPDLFAPGVSAVTLCPDACRGIRRAATLTLTVDHIYNCPE